LDFWHSAASMFLRATNRKNAAQFEKLATIQMAMRPEE
jgi:hypothetical protein